MKKGGFRVWCPEKKIFVTDKNLKIPYTGISLNKNGYVHHYNAVKLNWVVQLYTGLKDSLGDEIYEGDILQLNDQSKNYPTGEVYFGSGAFHVRGINCLWFGAKNGVCEDYLIRGNIFQNKIIDRK